MIGEFGHQHMGNEVLGRDAPLDETWLRRRLHHRLFASPAGIFGAARDDDLELSRHNVEAFRAALDRDSRLGECRLMLIRELYDQDRFAEARTEVLELLVREPSNREAKELGDVIERELKLESPVINATSTSMRATSSGFHGLSA